MFQYGGELPVNSINFITCHDGFTLNDLVSYNGKHNSANGEDNRDGMDDNLSWNCGAEGPTDDPGIEWMRNQQVKNAAAILLLSQGVPMILGGDEVRRTQGGNNNAYCQDNEISWFDWTLPEKHKDTLRFFQQMIAFRKAHPILRRTRFFNGQLNDRGVPDIAWHGCQLGAPGWDDPECRILAFTMGGFGDDPDMHVMMNMHWDSLPFEIPHIASRTWHRVVDTSLPSPDDICEQGCESPVDGNCYIVNPRSVVVLISKDLRTGREEDAEDLADPAGAAREMTAAIGKTPGNKKRR